MASNVEYTPVYRISHNTSMVLSVCRLYFFITVSIQSNFSIILDTPVFVI